jgi:hypothetical protein
MSLSAWEQDALNSIKNGLADSDPALWLVTTLTLIAAAVASSRASGPGTCAGSWGSLCGHAAGAPQAAQPIP